MTLKSTTMQTKPSKQLPIAWKPHDYQKRAIKFLLQNSCAALFLDPGLGKTGISLAALKIFLKEKLLECALIIAPLRVCHSVWPKEGKKWIDFGGLRIVVLHGKAKEKLLDTEADIYLINPEGLPWLLKHPKFKKKFRNQALFIDESSKFKHTNTQRFKLLRPFLAMFARRYILTGSPAPNGLLDLFGQIFILDLGASLGAYITHFRSKYFFPTGFGGYTWKLQKGADKIIQDRIRPLVLRLDAADYLKLPELIINDIYIDLDENSRAIYDEMEEDLAAAIERKEVVASSAAVASGKCSQIANGGIYDADGKAHFIHDIKAQVVDELVSELNGSPALVAYEYGHDLVRLKALLGADTPHIGGGVSTKRSTEIEEHWNQGELPVLLGQPQSIAHGLNLQQAGNHVIWHSLTWNFEDYDQFIRRVLRQGNTHNKVFVHRIIARDTTDELKIMALNQKFRTQKDLFDALNNFLKRKDRSKSKYPFTSGEGDGILIHSGNDATSNKEGTKMSKFAKKPKEEAAEAPKSAKKVKLWTNDPNWQDQETGVNTKAGDAQQAKIKSKGTKEAANDKPSKKDAKTAPAKKPAKKEKSEAASDDRKITLVSKENPKREGSAAHDRFELYRKAKTVQQFYDAGGTSADVRYDAKHGFIKVA